MDKLNEFLTYRDVRPVRLKLSAPWDDAHERTKRRYTSKAKESVREVLEVIAPGQSAKLWAALGDSAVVRGGPWGARAPPSFFPKK